MKTEHTPQWKSPTATLLKAERDRLKAANAEMLSVINEFLADQETMNEPYRNEAICEKARAIIAKAEAL